MKLSALRNDTQRRRFCAKCVRRSRLRRRDGCPSTVAGRQPDGPDLDASETIGGAPPGPRASTGTHEVIDPDIQRRGADRRSAPPPRVALSGRR